jgi:predicted nucleic acid-binding protein
VVELTQEIALLAAVLSIRHKLPMADSLVLATARTHAVDAGRAFQGLEGVLVVER